MLSVTESGTIERSRIMEKTNRGRAVVKERIRHAAVYIPAVQDRIACGSKEFDPLSRFPEGKPGRDGSPHAAVCAAAPPARGLRPLARSPDSHHSRYGS